ncbi:MAG: ROK family protein [candidate division WOR-3 bacterium]|nr:ROK family protein [candidate division WOR-3 bacterium]
MKALCFDIGGTNLKYGIVENYKVLYFKKERTDKYNLEEQINRIINSFEHDAISIGFAGVVKENKILFAPNLKTYQERELKINTDKRIVIDNDANLFTLGEYANLKNYENVIGITLGTGVGGGIVIGGKLYKGKGGAGEIGHITVVQDGALCNCGKLGCIEAYIGESYFPRYFENVFGKKLSANEIYNLALRNDSRAVEFWKWFSEKLSILINNLVCIFDPEVIVIGGGVSNAFDVFKNFLNVKGNVVVKKSELGEYASLIGGYFALMNI